MRGVSGRKAPSRFTWLILGSVTTATGTTGEVFIWDVGTAGRWVAAALYVTLFAAALWLDARRPAAAERPAGSS